MRHIAFVFSLLFCQTLIGQHLRLNEFNSSQTRIELQQYYFWPYSIEVFNSSEFPINLADYQLTTKSNEFVFDFESITLAPDHFHTAHLDAVSISIGTMVQLKNKLTREVVDEVELVMLTSGQSYGRIPDGTGPWSRLTEETLGAANFPSYYDDRSESNDWVRYRTNAEFGIRDGAGGVVFKNEMWLLGGWAHGPLVSDIYKSSDGITWEYQTTAPWGGRHQAGCVVFQDKMWVVGGDFYTDVWSSSDGINWEKVTDEAPWGSRYAAYVVVFNNKIWLMGGQSWKKDLNGIYDFNSPIGFNDVWSSSNGKDWELVTAAAAWAPRSMISGSVIFDNKMWIMGGGIKQNRTTLAEYNDVWNSEDGVNWQLITEHAPWSPRVHLNTTVYNKKIWITDGSPGTPAILTNEVWNSDDGVNWTEMKFENIWNPRHATTLYNYDGSLWMVAGFNGGDSWRYTDLPITYYSKESGDLSRPDGWGTLPSGDGDQPVEGDSSPKVFIVTNRTEAVIRETIEFIDSNSTLIVGDGISASILYVDEGAEIAASVDVSPKAAIIIQADIPIKFKKLYPDSEVVYNCSQPSNVSAGQFHKLQLKGHVKYIFPENVDIYDILISDSSRLVTNDIAIDVYGDVVAKGSNDFKETNLVAKGRMQQRFSSPDTLFVKSLAVQKHDSTLTFDGKAFMIDELQLHESALDIRDHAMHVTSMMKSDINSILRVNLNSEVKIPVRSEDVFVPLLYDSVRVPIMLRTFEDPELSHATVRVQSTDNLEGDAAISVRWKRLLKLGWHIETEGSMIASLFWDSLIEPESFYAQQIEALGFSKDQIEQTDNTFSVTSQDLVARLQLNFKSVIIKGALSALFVVDEPTFKLEVSLPDVVVYKEKVLLPQSSSTGQQVFYESLNPEIAIVKGDSLEIVGVGNFRVQGFVNSEVYAAADTIFDIVALKADQHITLTLEAEIEFSQRPMWLDASADSGLPLRFATSNSNIAQIENNQMILSGEGEVTISALQDGNDFYNPAVTTATLRVIPVQSPFRVYPNPSSGIFRIQLPDASRPDGTLLIRALNGQTVRSLKAEFPGTMEIDLSEIPVGVYTLEILAPGVIKTRKLIVSR